MTGLGWCKRCRHRGSYVRPVTAYMPLPGELEDVILLHFSCAQKMLRAGEILPSWAKGLINGKG